MISAYCLSYGNWTVIPSHWERVFADMRECGFDTVALSFSESEKTYAMRTFEQQVEYAHKQGLKVLGIPSRIGGRFAGAPMMPSPWLMQHSEALVPGSTTTASLMSPEFLEFSLDYIRTMLKSFDLDGLVLDEPKAVEMIDRSPRVLKRFGENPSVSDMYTLMLEYLQLLIDDAKKLKPDLSVTLFNMPPTPEEFTRASAKLRGLDYAGFDGPCSAQSFFHEPASHSKRFIRDSWERTKAETAGVTGSFALVENILIPDSAFEEFKQEYRRVLNEVKPDHLSIYYYGHNNESAETVQKFCMDELKKHIAEGGMK